MVLRVALVSESFLPQINGVTNSVLRILEGFARDGHEAMVIAPESGDGPSEYAGFRIKRVPSLEMKSLVPVGFPARALEPLIDGFAPDVIHLGSKHSKKVVSMNHVGTYCTRSRLTKHRNAHLLDSGFRL